MSKELAQELDPPVEQAEIDAAQQEAQEKPVEAEKPAPEAQDTHEEEKPPEKPPKGFVPQGALHEERQRRKELQAEIQRLQQEQQSRYQTLEQRFAQIQRAMQEQNAPKPPSYDEDPLGNLRHGVEYTQAQLKEIAERQQRAEYEAQEIARRQQYVGAIQNAVVQAETEFTKENPDYLDAVAYMKGLRVAQYKAMGMSEQEAVSVVTGEAYQVAERALQTGRSPAEVAFEMAKAAGWKKKEPVTQQDKIETLQKGVKAAKSLGSGGVPSGAITVDAVANMSDDEFAEFMKSGGWSKLG